MGLVERGWREGRLLPARSDTGPVTWKWCWLRRFLLLAGRLLAACCQEEKMTKDLLVVLVVDQTACHQEGGWSIRYLQLFCNCLIKKTLKYPLHIWQYIACCRYFSLDIHMDPLCTLMCVALANWIHVIIHVEKFWKPFFNKKKKSRNTCKKAHYFKVSTLQTGYIKYKIETCDRISNTPITA